jgi:putative SOS response-associated peptidase YedK
MVSENGQRVIKPMRYQCRLPDKPARNDVLYPGTYNARRDSLEGYWRGAFGLRHGVVVVQAFYEHVPRHAIAGRALGADEKEQDVVLEFRPDPPATCCWPASGRNGKDRKAACCHLPRSPTPPSDVAAAGHDRGVVPIRREHLDAWLNPDPDDLARQYRILDDREDIRYVYEEAG